MFRTALRNVLAHKARLVMTALAVLLGVAFVSGTLIFGDTVNQAYRSVNAQNFKDVDVAVRPTGAYGNDERGTPAPPVDEALAGAIRAVPGVAFVRGSVEGTATVSGKDKRPLGGRGYANVAANYAPGKDGKDPLNPLVGGRGPAAENELALDAGTAAAGGYGIGDEVRLAVDGPVLTKKLVGLVDSKDPRVSSGGSLVLFDTPTAQRLMLAPGGYHELTVKAEPGSSAAEVRAKISALLPARGAEALDGAGLAAAQDKQIDKNLSSMTKSLLLFAGIALFVGVFVIANTFTMLVAQRSREIALLRAIGASRRQVVRSVLIEAGLLGLAASALGLVLGLGVAVGLRAGLNAAGAGFPHGPLVVGPVAAAAAFAVGVLVTVLAAWLPSRRAAKIAPVEALAAVELAPAPRSLRVRNGIGAAVTALGIAVMLYVSTLRDSSGLLPAMAGSALTISGVIVLSPVLARPLVTGAGRLGSRFFGVSGKLAQENALRNPRRTAATASALMIGLTLVTGLTVAGHSAEIGLDKRAATGLTADFQIKGGGLNGLPEGAAAKLAGVPGVAAAIPVHEVPYRTESGGFGLLKGTDPARIGQVVDLKVTGGSLTEVRGDAIAVDTKTAARSGWQLGSTVKLASAADRSPAGEGAGEGSGSGAAAPAMTAYRIVAVYAPNEWLSGGIAEAAALRPLQPGADASKPYSVLVKKTGTADAGGLRGALADALDNNPLLKITEGAELRDDAAGPISSVLNMMYGLLAMAVVIAILGVINTLAMSVHERTREIGMLRAIGLDRSGIMRMVRLESVVISLFGAVLGMGTGVFLAWAGGNLTASAFETYEMVLPWGRLALFLAMALVVGVLAAIWPARRAAGLNVLDAVNTR